MKRRAPLDALALALTCAAPLAACSHTVRLTPAPSTALPAVVRVDGRPVGPLTADGLDVDVDVGPADVGVEADGVVVAAAARHVDAARVVGAAAVAVPVGVAAGSAAWAMMNAPQVLGVFLDPLGLPQGLLAPSAWTLPVAFGACVTPFVLAAPFIVAPPAEIALSASTPSTTLPSTTTTATTTTTAGVTP